ncbi:MAG: molybdate ABC transporter permease subunit [Anaerolineales bacterium]|nr:molybdate ABC transporter permease subunit [Anaerolineales bacterium]
MWEPLLLSLRVAIVATLLAVIFGVLIAALLAYWRHPASGLLDAFANLPLVLPPTVLGYYLLVTWGAQSPLGEFLEELGFPLVFTWRGAVLAAAFVGLPLVIQSTRAALESVDPNLRDVAKTLGRSDIAIFLSISLPLAWRGLLTGAILAFARALGEFGATLMIAGNIPGKTQTLPIAIYDAVQSGDQSRANILALGLTLTAIILLVVIRRLGTRLAGERVNG